MKVYAIEEGEFATDGETDDTGSIIGELTDARGTRRWAVKPSQLDESPTVKSEQASAADALSFADQLAAQRENDMVPAAASQAPEFIAPVAPKGGRRR